MLVHLAMPTSCREDLMLDGTTSSLYNIGKNVPLVTISTQPILFNYKNYCSLFMDM